MNVARYRIVFVLLPLLAFSWLLLVLADADTRWGSYALAGYLVGTLFGQATLAAAWTALGPGPLLWRLPLSLAWIAALVLSLVAHRAAHRGFNTEEILLLAACLAAQWLLVQIPLWGMSVAYGVRLRYASDPPATAGDRQFGIRQLMILTAIVAVVLGACRMLVAQSAVRWQDTHWGAAVIIGCLAIAGIIMTLPLLLAALLPRYSVPAVAALLLLIGLGTWYESQLLLIVSGGGAKLHLGSLVALNAFQAAWIVTVAALVRACGYGIGPPLGQSPFAGQAAAVAIEPARAP